nr:unnamed protein product [Callosobruchus analis]
MDGSRKCLTEKELEEIVREIEAGQSDDIGFSNDSSDSGIRMKAIHLMMKYHSEIYKEVQCGKNGYKLYCKRLIKKIPGQYKKISFYVFRVLKVLPHVVHILSRKHGNCFSPKTYCQKY